VQFRSGFPEVFYRLVKGICDDFLIKMGCFAFFSVVIFLIAFPDNMAVLFVVTVAACYFPAIAPSAVTAYDFV